MDTFRTNTGEITTARRIAGLDPNMLITILVVLVIIILLVLLFNMSSGSDSSGSNAAAPQAGFFNPLNAAMRNNNVRNAPVVTTATTTRAV
ncbi:odv-e18 [Clostera anastomosis granulovirus A]|uniref:Odv-e18 n=1 Tax=Clostera anastomosis granulovirus A TaxID=1986289 RepID=U5KAR6_9BBAC|nr:odv-e18 [Clostera anastomosis granulovirus Henan]AGQ20272.1 odv-e18 [Clostera anastomosis granulovirus Henan]